MGNIAVYGNKLRLHADRSKFRVCAGTSEQIFQTGIYSRAFLTLWTGDYIHWMTTFIETTAIRNNTLYMLSKLTGPDEC